MKLFKKAYAVTSVLFPLVTPRQLDFLNVIFDLYL